MNNSKLLQQMRQSALAIPAIYLAFGLTYTGLSYWYTRVSIVPEDIHILNGQTLFRLVFLLLSSVLLYFLIKSYHKKLNFSLEQNLKLFRDNPHPMWVFDANTLQFLAVNQAAIEKYGYTREEFLSLTIKDIRPQEEIHSLAEKRSYKEGFNLSGIWKHQLRNKTIIDVEISTHTMVYEGRDAKLTLAYDVTDRVNYEHQILDFNHALELRVNERTKELHESLQEQAALTEELETSNEELMITNEQLVLAQNIIHQHAETRLRQSQYRLEQVLKSVDDFVWSAQLQNGQMKLEMLSPAIFNILGISEEEHRADSTLWFNAMAEQDQERVRDIFAHLGKRPYEEIEYCIRHPKTWQIKYVLSRIWITRIEENSFQLTGIISDVSERKKEEEEKSSLIKQLINQNNDLLQFSYIASHNLRGPVATLLGLIQLIEKEEKPSDIKAISTHLLYSTRKLDDVIADLTKILEIRNMQYLPKEHVSLNDIIDNIKKTLFIQIENSNAIIDVDFSEVESFFTIKTYLHSIIYNLVSNGIKYRSTDRAPVITITSFKNENNIGLVISDNGLGLDVEKYEQKLFKLYQRFHTHIDGKGLGLYLVKTQTTALGGDIDVTSTLGKGTTFQVTFPVHYEVVA